MIFRLAPLGARRGMAMLGAIHRTVIGKGPQHFHRWFYLDTTEAYGHTRRGERRHRFQLVSYRTGGQTNTLARSAMGFVDAYNMLPGYIVDATSVSSFQGFLQGLLSARAAGNCQDWADTFSPRLPLHLHPLLA